MISPSTRAILSSAKPVRLPEFLFLLILILCYWDSVFNDTMSVEFSGIHVLVLVLVLVLMDTHTHTLLSAWLALLHRYSELQRRRPQASAEAAWVHRRGGA